MQIPQKKFIPAKPIPVLLWTVQNVLGVSNCFQNQIRISEGDLKTLCSLPRDSGLILTPNHADETDPTICLALSRLSKRRFIFMGNREAFSEYGGLAGLGLQSIGMFSVERGGHDLEAKSFAENVVKSGKDLLVIFPEGEIFYLNDTVQPFHSGAIDIGIQAILEERRRRSDWTAHIVPMAIKYRYTKPIGPILEKRISQMERKLSQDRSGHEMRKRVAEIMSQVLQNEEAAFHVQADSARYHQLSDRVTEVRHALLNEIEQKYANKTVESKEMQARTIDRAWKLSAQLRDMMPAADANRRTEYRNDLKALNEVAHMVSWQPDYVDLDPSTERLAEVVLKLEREVFGVKRPRQLAPREVFVSIGEPLDLAPFIPDYQSEPHSVRHRLANQLRESIQSLIDGISIANAQPNVISTQVPKSISEG